MLELLFQRLDHALRWLTNRALSSHAYLCLWLLRRFFHCAPLFKLIPFAYAISAIANIIFVATTYGSLWLIVMGTRNWLMAVLLLLVAFLISLRYRRYGLAAFVGLLVLVGNSAMAPSSRLLLCVLNLGIAFITWQELSIARGQFQFKPFYMSNINEGSAKTLHGNIHVVHVFVHAEQEWNDTRMRSAHAAASRALEWLVTQAERYEVKIRFKQEILWKPYAKVIPGGRADEGEHLRFGDWLNGLLRAQFAHFEHTTQPNCFVIVHANDGLEECLAYALPKHILHGPTDRPEYAVVGPPHDAPIYAHEILHLFGADDLYMAAYDRHESPIRATLLAKCIMFDGAKADFSHAVVDDLTAQNVGWF